MFMLQAGPGSGGCGAHDGAYRQLESWQDAAIKAALRLIVGADSGGSRQLVGTEGGSPVQFILPGSFPGDTKRHLITKLNRKQNDLF